MSKLQSAERVSQHDPSDNYVFQRSQLAYYEAAKLVSGDVLEIGTGSGYGVEIISPHAKSFLTVDKYDVGIDFRQYPNSDYRKMTVPPLTGIENAAFDYVISFQVIEHIKDDFGTLREIHRVLRPGGKLIITTPNRNMSLTRNPWHVREYSVDEFTNLLRSTFKQVESNGVFGNESVMEYYQKNKESVERIAKFDIFNFQKWLPRPILRIPYNVMNRLNRRKLLKQNQQLTSQIAMDDYSIAPAKSDSPCFDLFYIAQK